MGILKEIAPGATPRMDTLMKSTEATFYASMFAQVDSTKTKQLKSARHAKSTAPLARILTQTALRATYHLDMRSHHKISAHNFLAMIVPTGTKLLINASSAILTAAHAYQTPNSTALNASLLLDSFLS